MQVEDTGQPAKDLSQTVCRVCGRDDGSLLWDRHGVPKYLRLLRYRVGSR
ncbi:hypothetical protein ACIRJM_41365 [Streptomyces sp. NPDC102405]